MQGQIGFFNRPWTQWTLETALDGMVSAGASCLGLLRQQGELVLGHDSTRADAQELARSIRDRGLSFLVSLVPVDLDRAPGEARARFLHLVDLVHRMGGRYALSTGAPKLSQKDQYVSLMKATVGHAARQGVQIVLKPHGGISATARDCVEIVERVASDNFRVWYDPGNVLWYAGVRPEEDVAAVARYVTGVCVKDCRLGPEKSVTITPGTGEVDFRRVYAALREAGFSGPNIIETLAGETPEQVDAEARTAVQFVTQLLAQG